ncbi:hypothetical protein MASR2M48_19610 [Spirochaetota bacterium]
MPCRSQAGRTDPACFVDPSLEKHYNDDYRRLYVAEILATLAHARTMPDRSLELVLERLDDRNTRFVFPSEIAASSMRGQPPYGAKR